MPFLIIWGILAFLGVAFPGFTKFLNYGLLFPFASLAIGSLSWSFLSLFTGGALFNFPSWILCLFFIGVPIAWKVAKFSEE